MLFYCAYSFEHSHGFVDTVSLLFAGFPSCGMVSERAIDTTLEGSPSHYIRILKILPSFVTLTLIT